MLARVLVLFCWLCPSMCFAQERIAESSAFDRKNTWTVLADYSNTSSHIIAGRARQRELVTLGGAYTRRIVRFWGTELGYRVEVRPVIFESDPVQLSTVVYSGANMQTFTGSAATAGVCRPFTSSMTYPEPQPYPSETITTVATCGRQWTFGQSMSPFGVKYGLAIRHRVQPYLIGTLGYMYTSRPVPVSTAEAFNFVVDAGAGVEVYRSRRRSLSIETRVRHISNRDTAQTNPGVDNVTYGVSYHFGR